MPLDAVAVANAQYLDAQAAAHLEITAAFPLAERRRPALDQTHVSHEPRAVVFVAQVRPYDVVEDVGL
jgi:hypothetical protein